MTAPYDRPAALAAFVNAVVAYLLPLALFGAIAFVASDHGNGSTHVVGVDPDRAAVWSRRVWFIGAYLTGLAPFAMAAAWRTLVHARRWADAGSRGALGILEGAACGFAGALLVLLPGIVTRPIQALPLVLAYGGLAAVLGLGAGAVLWISATLTLRLFGRRV